MAYRLTEIGHRTYVGKNSAGDLNIEVWNMPKNRPDAELEHDVFVPADAIDALFEYLRRN